MNDEMILMKKFFSIFGGAVVFLYICLIEIVCLELPLFYNYGFEENSFIENTLIYSLTFISGVLTALITKRSTLKKFVRSAVMFWAIYLILFFVYECLGARYIVHWWITGYEVYAMSEDWLIEDIWLFHWAACFVGTVVAGIITYKIERIESDGAS